MKQVMKVIWIKFSRSLLQHRLYFNLYPAKDDNKDVWNRETEKQADKSATAKTAEWQRWNAWPNFNLISVRRDDSYHPGSLPAEWQYTQTKRKFNGEIWVTDRRIIQIVSLIC